MGLCPKCGYDNVDANEYCPRCGAYPVDGPSTGLLAPDRAAAEPQGPWQRRDPERLAGEAVLVLIAPNGAAIVLPPVPTVNLGREGLSPAGMAAISLAPYGAEAAGVSRLHARIHRLSTGFFVEDCDSTNGTYLNGQRLAAYMPQGLATGDELQLGELRFGVAFQPAE